MKRLVSLLLSVLMLVSMFSIVPFTVSSKEVDVAQTADTEYYTYGDYEYDLMGFRDDVWITKYTGSATNLTIPSTIDGHKVIYISYEAFAGCTSLKSVVIPNGVTEIGGSAFKGCINLESVTIPDSVTSIYISAFEGCEKLDSVTLPDSVTYLDWSVFEDCTSLKSITLPSGITSISFDLFKGCTSLESIIIPDGVVRIGDSAFWDCTSLKSINIPDSVTTIAFGAFSGCTALTTITIPDGVTIIESWAFWDCTSLKSITIPRSVTQIEGSAFSYCVNLTDVYYGGTQEEWEAICEDNTLNSTKVTKHYQSTGPELPQLTDISGCSITLSTSSYTYDGYAKKPSVTVKDGSKTLTNGTDYTVSYSNNINVGTATVKITGVGNYTGTATKSFTVSAKSISSSTITLSQSTYTYDGYAKTPGVTVKDGSKTLTNGTDYTVSYSNNINVGSATVKITGVGNYEGSTSKYFTIQEAQKTSISSCTVTLSQTSYTYDGYAKKPSVTVKDGSKTLTSGTDYTVSYSNNTNVGTATVTVTGKGNYTGSVNKTFTIKSTKEEFVWGKDNWDFNNSSSQGYFKNSTYREHINSTYANALKNNLTNSEYQVIFEGYMSYYGWNNAWLDDMFGGSCYGMSSTALLAKEGLLPYSQYKSGATELNDLSYPKADSKVSSLVTYYQMLQVKDVIQQQYRTVKYRSNKTNIENIIELLDENSTVLIGYRQDDWGGHAVLATGYEYGSWTWNGVAYQGCIKICDPNSSVSYNNKYNIYFNTQSYNWVIPAYSAVKSVNGAVFNYVGADVDEINEGGYLTGTHSSKVENYVARIDAPIISENRSVTKVKESGGSYITQNTAPGDIIEDYSYILGNESEGTIGYNLYDSDASYKVSQDNAEELQLTMSYDNCYLAGGSKAGSSVIFDKNGYIEVNGETADYNMTMTFNDNYPTDWFTIAVSGSTANKASLTMAEEGYILSADCLDDVNVGANNREVSAKVSFSTEYDSVLIYEIDENTIGIKVDTDSNGTYETPVDTTSDLFIGDVDGDKEVSIMDATQVQLHVAKIVNLTGDSLLCADTDNDQEISIMDATEIQLFVARIITEFKPR